VAQLFAVLSLLLLSKLIKILSYKPLAPPNLVLPL